MAAGRRRGARSAGMTASFRGLVFDFDGTLIDSAPELCHAINQVLAAEGRRALTLDETKDLIGQGTRVLVERAFSLAGAPGSMAETDRRLEAFLAVYNASPAEATHVFPGAREALESLSAAGVAIGLCTNKPARSTNRILAGLGLDRYFDVVSCGDQVPHRKPDARHVLRVVEELGTTLRTTALIGDSENDIAAARSAGIPSVAVTFGYAHIPHAELGADALIDHFAELPEALRMIAVRRKIA